MNSIFLGPLAALGALLGASLMGCLLADLKRYIDSRKFNPASGLWKCVARRVRGEVSGAGHAGELGSGEPTR